MVNLIQTLEYYNSGAERPNPLHRPTYPLFEMMGSKMARRRMTDNFEAIAVGEPRYTECLGPLPIGKFEAIAMGEFTVRDETELVLVQPVVQTSHPDFATYRLDVLVGSTGTKPIAHESFRAYGGLVTNQEYFDLSEFAYLAADVNKAIEGRY